MVKIIEIIATSIEDAKRIEKAGADRIELISAYSEGGLTPSFALIKGVRSAVEIPVNVIIRPHSNSFVYSDEEIEMMMQDILCAKKLGANGVVIGVLNHQNEIDVPKLQRLLSVCDGLDVTFHRAIDETDVCKSVEILNQYPQITSILTSGGIKTPIEQNIEVIKGAISKSGHIDILLGGGLTLDNVAMIKEQTLAECFHLGSAVRSGQEIDVDKIRQVRASL